MSNYPYQPDLDEPEAMTEALKALFKDLPWAVGKTVGRVVAEWSDGDKATEYPTIVVLPISGGDFENMTPRPLPVSWLPEGQPGHVLWQIAEYVADAEISVVGSDRFMRSMVCRAVREKLMGRCTDGTYERKFDVPRYYNGAAKMSVTVESLDHEDTPKGAQSRYRKATFGLRVRMPVLQVESAVPLLPRYEVSVID